MTVTSRHHVILNSVRLKNIDLIHVGITCTLVSDDYMDLVNYGCLNLNWGLDIVWPSGLHTMPFLKVEASITNRIRGACNCLRGVMVGNYFPCKEKHVL
jgi:hypothetical protein